MSVADLPVQVRNSRWWYWIAAVPVLYTVLFAVLAVFIVPFILNDLGLVEFGVVFGLDESSVALLAAAIALPSFLLTLILPYALYRDIGILEKHGAATAWDPDQDEYAILGAAGIFVTGVGFIVSVYYLYQRHTHIGTP